MNLRESSDHVLGISWRAQGDLLDDLPTDPLETLSFLDALEALPLLDCGLVASLDTFFCAGFLLSPDTLFRITYCVQFSRQHIGSKMPDVVTRRIELAVVHKKIGTFRGRATQLRRSHPDELREMPGAFIEPGFAVIVQRHLVVPRVNHLFDRWVSHRDVLSVLVILVLKHAKVRPSLGQRCQCEIPFQGRRTVQCPVVVYAGQP